ncbi:hypothetical protein ADUPG1_002222 [Aduncisulcus paluster]|uniref:Leucine-rich repeat protein n=1 Tax=Aduncisulcus paluster TaxID=2918883 RepID=A0ABQ5KHX3_9EUKA|nr:hypothetical protein ADUPG1_002222 [Aduncisulcus paluster]
MDYFSIRPNPPQSKRPSTSIYSRSRMEKGPTSFRLASRGAPPTSLKKDKRQDERLILEKQGLSSIPAHVDPAIRLLNLKDNAITCITNLNYYQSLVFLDLSGNMLESLRGVEEAPRLRVLMAGYNRLSCIEPCIASLSELDVLDLRGNVIEVVENLHTMHRLRILNISDNRISSLDNLSGLHALTELNVRRNKIQKIGPSISTLPALMRLYISNNNIAQLSDIVSIFSIQSLRNFSIRSNPVTLSSSFEDDFKSMASRLQYLPIDKVLHAALGSRQDVVPGTPIASSSSVPSVPTLGDVCDVWDKKELTMPTILKIERESLVCGGLGVEKFLHSHGQSRKTFNSVQICGCTWENAVKCIQSLVISKIKSVKIDRSTCSNISELVIFSHLSSMAELNLSHVPLLKEISPTMLLVFIAQLCPQIKRFNGVLISPEIRVASSSLFPQMPSILTSLVARNSISEEIGQVYRFVRSSLSSHHKMKTLDAGIATHIHSIIDKL